MMAASSNSSRAGDQAISRAVAAHSKTAAPCTRRPMRLTASSCPNSCKHGRTRPHQQPVEIARAHHPGEAIEAARQHVGQREADLDHAVQQGDLGQGEAANGAEAVEQRPDPDELDAGDQQHAQRLHDDRGAVLQLRAQRDCQVAQVKPKAVAHARGCPSAIHRYPPCTTIRRAQRPSSQRPSATSARVQHAWCSSTKPACAAGMSPV